MSNKKIYVPSCKECNGLLSFKINPLNFSIEFECEKNKNHNKNNIYFKTFERFYLKEKDLIKCSKCYLNLENSEFFNCDICKNIYCCKCYIEDIQNKGHKNIINNITNNNRCLIHGNEFIEYCFNCKKNICISCIKNDIHKEHKKESYIDIIPSSEDIENLKNKIKVKTIYINKLIENIDNWQKKINLKVKELIQNLRDEINLLEKIIFNFNNTFRNITYLKNFTYIKEYLKNISNNKNLVELNKAYEFEKKTEILLDIFKYLGRNINKNNKIKKTKGSLSIIKNINYQLVQRINDNFFIDYGVDKSLNFSYYDEKVNSICLIGKINLNDYLYSISLSTIENKIFICLLYDKKIKIIDYNLELGSININDKEIISNSISNINHFYKCIQLSKLLYATSDDNNIIIWSEDEEKFFIKSVISLNANSFDMLLIDENHFISTQPDKKNITISDLYYFDEILKIKNVDCSNSNNCLFKINNKYVVISCFNGIGLLYIPTKELVQYIQNYYSFPNTQKISCDNEGKIYILNIEKNKVITNSLFGNTNSNFNNYNYKVEILVGKIIDGTIKLIKEYEKFDSFENMFKFTFLNKNCFILWGRNSYIFKEFE